MNQAETFEFNSRTRCYVQDNRANMPDATAQDYLDHYDAQRAALAAEDSDHGYPALTDEQRARFIEVATVYLRDGFYPNAGWNGINGTNV